MEPYIVQLDTRHSKSYPYMDFVKGDIGSNIIHITLTDNGKPISLIDKIVTVTIRKPDNNKVVYDVDIIDNYTAQFIPDANALSVIGTVLVTIEVYEGVYRKTLGGFQYKVSESLNDDNDVASFSDYPILTRLISDVQTTVETITETNSNITIEENTRIYNEDDRISNENDRQIAETIRVNVFNDNETLRINTFNNNETKRQTNEDIRIIDENNRKTEFNVLKTDSENATNYAINRGNYALEQGDNALDAATDTRLATANYQDVVDQTKKIYIPSVNTYSEILTTYPTPEIGWTTQTKDTHIEYRWDGVEWVDIGVTDAFQGYNVYVGPTPPTNTNLLWIKTEGGESRMARVLPSQTEPVDKNVIWWKID